MNRKLIAILSVVVIALAVPVTVFLSQQNQDIRQKASTGTPLTSNFPQTGCPVNFTDVAGKPYATAVYCLNQTYCITSGFNQEATPLGLSYPAFGGDLPLTRAFAVAFITRYHTKILGDWALKDPATGTAFPDVPTSYGLAREIETAYNSGFIKGNGGNFDPEGDWIYDFYGVNREDYFGSSGPLHPTNPTTRGLFLQKLYNYGIAADKLPKCMSIPIPPTATPVPPTSTPIPPLPTSTPIPPTPTSTPQPIAPLASPTNLKPNGTIQPGTTSVTWDAVPGATGYDLRIDDTTVPNSWSGSCSSVNTGDVCTSIGSNTYPYNFIAGHTYRIWVSAKNSSQQSPDSAISNVTVTTPAACNSTCTQSGECASAKDGCTVCANNRCSQPVVACNSVCNPANVNADCAGAKDGCTVCNTTSKTCTSPQASVPACNSTCSIDADCVGAQNGCTVCNNDKKCSAPPAACNSTCTDNFSCAGAKDGCTACVANKCAAAETTFAVTFKQHGIGYAGDLANPNPSPLYVGGTLVPVPTPIAAYQSRSATFYLSTGKTVTNDVLTYEYFGAGNVTYDASTTSYKGTLKLNSTPPAGQYIAAIRTSNSLTQQAIGFITVTPGTAHTISFPALVTGNVYDSSLNNVAVTNDNQLDILDYNVIMDAWTHPELCASQTGDAKTYCDTLALRADLNADGKVDFVDYNLFIRELSVQRGR